MDELDERVPQWDRFNQSMKQRAAEIEAAKEGLKAYNQEVNAWNREQQQLVNESEKQGREQRMAGITRSINSVGVSQWRKTVEVLKAGKKELDTYQSMMSPNERRVVREDIQQKQQAYWSAVYNGVMGEVFEPALQKFKNTQEKATQAKTNEIKRWDPAKLRDEIQVAGMLLDNAFKNKNNPLAGGPNRADIARQIFEEAVQSGDIYKQRAACEAMRGLTMRSDNHDERLNLTMIEGQAKNHLNQLRITDEMHAVDEELNKAREQILQARAELIDTAQSMGDDPTYIFANSAYSNALKRIKTDQNGNIEILSPEEVQSNQWGTITGGPDDAVTFGG